jgi:2-oxoglutarate ferredoxin oxidoreductase subunit beta
LIFGKERDKGIRLNRQNLSLEVIDLNSDDADEALIHDETNKVLAQMLATMSAPELPVAVGVIYREDRTTYDDASRQQVTVARDAKASLQTLLHSGHTWVVE